jgi:TatD DNase family protein
VLHPEIIDFWIDTNYSERGYIKVSTMFVDSHAHLDMVQFDSDRDEVIERALAADVRHVVTVGIDVKSSRKAIALTKRYPSVFATVGVHPHSADNAQKDDLRQIASMCSEKKVVAIGEIGLDFYRNLSSRHNHMDVFKQQLEIAVSCELPVVIHDRDAHDEVLKVLSSFKGNESKGVIHCFSGDHSLAEAFINMGYCISIPGTVTFPGASLIHDVVVGLPIERMLLETDSPFLSPVPYRGRRNEPCHVIHTAQKVAEIKGIPLEEVARQTSRNVGHLFGIPSLI